MVSRQRFFDDDLFLYNAAARVLYSEVRDLPIIDYHCHLDAHKIADNAALDDVGALWLAGDHYKWRAMRLCGVDEYYITGEAPYAQKFRKYAEILPKLAGNPLYYWTHLELQQIFGVNEPLNGDSAARIYAHTNKRLQGMHVRDLLQQYKVQYVATTDDPASDLAAHGTYDGTTVAPTFRPDKLFLWEDAYLAQLGKAAGVSVKTLADVLTAVQRRLDFFVTKGCKISDHGMAKLPAAFASESEAQKIFENRKSVSAAQMDALNGFLLVWLSGEYKKRNMLMQLHLAPIRNLNPTMFARLGPDAGFDSIGDAQPLGEAAAFLARVRDEERPLTVVYTLHDGNLAGLAALSGAFRNVRMGAAWWFNDTAEGIRRNLSAIAEYAVLGTNLGMLTDSRSFSSYARFDFFRRILCNYIGDLAEKGEYDMGAARTLVADVCYNNIKEVLSL